MKGENLKFYIKTFGCQMNVRDSEVICGLLKTMNYELTTDTDDADIIIFNTCSVRQHAEDKVWSELGRFYKRNTHNALRNKRQIIGIAGCMAQNYKEKIFERAPFVDFVVGPSDIHRIPEIIKEFESTLRNTQYAGRNTHYALRSTDHLLQEKKIWETEGRFRPDYIYHTGFYENKDHAYVVISEGCSNRCSYCVVPYVRGPLKNRNYKDILREIESAVDKGISEITLLGQNVNAYEYNGVNFVKLVEMVNSVIGLKNFSFITSHPKDTDTELFKAMVNLDKCKKYLHLPVQSGSDRILELMGRGYTRKFYLELVDNYRKIVKKGKLTTDIMVGFPTESEEDFQDTVNLVKDVEFDSAYIFKYSVRPHTEAEKLNDDVPKIEKEKRHRIILDLQKKISKDRINGTE